MKASQIPAICLALFFGAANAQEFDRSLLDGVWAESTGYQFGCVPSNLHQRLELSPDGKTLTFKNDRKWKISTGHEVTQYSATVLRSTTNVLIIKYDTGLEDIPDEFREWEMRFIGPGTYLWRATSWPANQFNAVIGVKCKQ